MDLGGRRFEHEGGPRVADDGEVVEGDLGDGPLVLRKAKVWNGEEAVDVGREDECDRWEWRCRWRRHDRRVTEERLGRCERVDRADTLRCVLETSEVVVLVAVEGAERL